jgi:hypothetical protein
MKKLPHPFLHLFFFVVFFTIITVLLRFLRRDIKKKYEIWCRKGLPSAVTFDAENAIPENAY